MNPGSAAVARAATSREPPELESRLRSFLAQTSQGDERGLAGRLLPTDSCGRPARLPAQEGFYWLRICRWLAESFRLTAEASGRRLLADLEWIQYCVYGVLRVQDDLLDGETGDARLAVGTNHLLVEASSRAARHFPGDSPFWTVYRETIGATSRALLTLDRLQRVPERPSHAELELYEELAACLKIAAAGVAIAAGREGDWRHRISPALDRLAVAAQIVDDLRDVSDDLAGGRINYVAWYLSRPVFATTPEAMEAVVASNLMNTDRLDRLLASAGCLLAEAVDLLPTAVCPRTYAYLDGYRRGLCRLGSQIDDSRQKLLTPASAG